jgi:4-diphosphocytidyl-2-C-methyl-D-erythritol kinase
MICFPNIKINLGLQVIDRRTDGFHNIESVFYPVKFCDVLEVIASNQAQPYQFSSSGLPINGNVDDNLVIKAYQLLAQTYALPPVHIYLHKLIPMGAGLGGGSSNAAFMLTLLNDTFNLALSTAQLENYAAQLGSDCPFFIRNKPAYLLGKGHELTPFELDLSGYYIVLLYANVHSNTALAYSRVKRRETLEPHQSLKHALAQPIHTWKNTIENDFEPSVFAQFPILATLKQQLYEQGALYASMSGSGSAAYGLFAQKPQLNNQLRPWVCFEGEL